jgi:arylamine N-acetyltransferase
MTVPCAALCYALAALSLSDQPSPAWLDAYVSMLGLQREPPSLEFLRTLTRAHVSRVPFENVTSILRRAEAGDGHVPPLDRETELRSWINRRGGGVCFEVVDMVGALLEGLGFKTHPVLAKISFAGSHQANLVEFDGGAQYLVDAGNGAPFFEPIAIAANEPSEFSHAGLAYRFRAAEEPPGQFIQDRLIDGEWQPFCTYDLAPATDVGRAEAYRRHHTRGHSWVVDNLTLVRPTEDAVWALRDDRLTHHTTRGKTVTSLNAPADYARAAAELFEMPAAPMDAALAAVRRVPQP